MPASRGERDWTGGYRKRFVAANGPFPHSCYFCGGSVPAPDGSKGRLSPVVHHVDLDCSNDDLDNLVAAHRGCHSAYHLAQNPACQTPEAHAKASRATRGRPKPTGFGAKVAAANRARGPRSAETRAKISAAHRGGRLSAGHRAQISETLLVTHSSKSCCLLCRLEISSVLVGRHMRRMHGGVV